MDKLRYIAFKISPKPLKSGLPATYLKSGDLTLKVVKKFLHFALVQAVGGGLRYVFEYRV